ncbi:retrovirus-related pol polyprotein from transposon TNT 1-94 [Tanacetum coccineum]
MNPTASKCYKDGMEQPKDVRPSAPIVEEWESDSDNDCVIRPSIEQNKPIFTKSGNVLVYTAKQQLLKSKPVSNSTARYVNTAASRPTVNGKPPICFTGQGCFDSGCSRHMTGNKSYLTDYQDIDGGFVAFAGSPKGGKITRKRCDNGTEFKNSEMNQLCEMKGIKIEFSVARTPQQNRVAERKNRTLIEAARTMLADSLLPTTFWAEAINTACYVQNRVLITKPHNKTPYELLISRSPNLDFMRPFGCPVTILNTLDHLGKFEGKADEGFLVGYSVNSKAFRVFNTRTKKVEENLHIKFLENKPNVARSGPEWLFDIDSLTKSMNYEPVSAGNQTNDDAGIETNVNAVQTGQEKASNHEYILLPFLTSDSQGPKSSDDEFVDDAGKKNDVQYPAKDEGQSFDNNDLPTDPLMPDLEDSTGIFRGAYDDEDVGAEADLNNLETTMNVSPIPTTRIHKDHPKDSIIGDINSAIQTRRMINFSEENAMVSYISKQRRTNHKDYQNCLFACFLSQIEPKKVIQELTYPSWIEAMQEELLQFKLQKVWTLVNLPKGKRAIGTKWVYRKKKDERGIIVRNKARLVVQGYTQEEGIDFDEVFALVVMIEAIRRELQCDAQPPALKSHSSLIRVYKGGKSIIMVLTSSTYSLYETLSTYLIENGFRRGTIDKTLFIKKDKGLQVQQKKDGIFISQDKYVVDILKKFDFITVKTASTPTETNKALIKDEEAENVDRIFRYLKCQPKLGLWYPRDSLFDLEAFSDSDYARASLYMKSTTGGCQFLGKRLINGNVKKQTIVAHSTTEAKDSYEKKLIQVIKIHTDHNVADLLTKAFDVSRGKAIEITEIISEDELFDDEDGITCLTNDEIFENLALMGSQVPRNHRGAPAQTRSERVLKQPNEPPLSEGHTSGSGEGRMEHTFELMDIVPPTPHDSPLPGGYTPGSDEGRLKLEELMAMCTKLSKQVLDLEKEKDAQAVEILKLKKRVKKLERQRKSSISHPRRRIYRQVESSDDDLDEEDASKQGRTSDKTKPMFKDSDFDDLDDLVDEGMDFVQEKDAENQGKIGADDTKVVKGSGDTEAVNTAGEGVSTAAPRTPPTTTTVFDDEDVTMAMAQTLIKMKEEKAKEKGVAIKDVEDSSRPIRSITTLQPLPTIDPKDKGKGILQKTESVEKTKKKVQGDAHIERDAEARIDADYELAARMTQEEQEKYTIKERVRNCWEVYKHSQLKGKSYEEIQGLYERQQKRIQDFTPVDSEKEAQKSGKVSKIILLKDMIYEALWISKDKI